MQDCKHSFYNPAYKGQGRVSRNKTGIPSTLSLLFLRAAAHSICMQRSWVSLGRTKRSVTPLYWIVLLTKAPFNMITINMISPSSKGKCKPGNQKAVRWLYWKRMFQQSISQCISMCWMHRDSHSDPAKAKHLFALRKCIYIQRTVVGWCPFIYPTNDSWAIIQYKSSLSPFIQ